MKINQFCFELNKRKNIDFEITPGRLIKLEIAGTVPTAERDVRGFRMYNTKQYKAYEKAINNRPKSGRPKGITYENICLNCSKYSKCKCEYFRPKD